MFAVLGAIADFTKSKKRFLLLFTSISIVSTALLFFVGEGDVFMGMFFFIVAEIGYRMAQVFYDALLTDVATPETIGFVSGKGWAVGMLGGIIALVFVLVPIQIIGNHAVRYTFLITAGFYLLSSIPTFVWVREKPGQSRTGSGIVGPAFRKLASTFRHAKQYKEFIKYMIAYLIYNDGIMMLMDFAAIIGLRCLA
jgi:UMF1 family MFS transporter